MQVISLQSGSNGNSIYVESRGVRLLFDAGISGSRAEERLATHGRDIRRVDALVISHDHVDHSKCMGIYQRKFGLPVHVTRRTFDAAKARHDLGCIEYVHHFRAGAKLDFGRVTVETICTPHDGADGVAFVVDDGRSRLGILTDLGHVFGGLGQIIETLDAVLIESNYDPGMLEDGPYPEFLKRRIQGEGGHLSNDEAAELLRKPGNGMRWACLGHLSEQNNSPEVALKTHRRALGHALEMCVAGRYEVGPVLEV